jgi:hypothetical protein
VQLIRDEFFVFEEDQRINLQERYSYSNCVNKVLESIVNSHRSASMSADPSNPDWTIFEQKMSISISSALGNTIKTQLESFAEGLFLSAAKSGTTQLEETLRAEAERATATALLNSANGGGVWWTGGDQTVPGANVHTTNPAMPEDSSSAYFSETLDSWANWMWPTFFSSQSPAGPSDPSSTAVHSTSAQTKGGTGSVWWSDGEEWERLDIAIDTGRPDSSESAAAFTTAACAGMCFADAGTRRKPLRRVASLARRGAKCASSPAMMLAGIAAQVASAGEHHFAGASDKDFASSRDKRKVSQNDIVTSAPSGMEDGEAVNLQGRRRRGRFTLQLKRSNSHPELKDTDTKHVGFGWRRFGGTPPLRGASRGQISAAAFVSSSIDVTAFIASPGPPTIL